MAWYQGGSIISLGIKERIFALRSSSDSGYEAVGYENKMRRVASRSFSLGYALYARSRSAGVAE